MHLVHLEIYIHIFIHGTWLIHSSQVPWLIHTWQNTLLRMTHSLGAPYIHATWLIRLIHVTCLIHIWQNTHSYSHDSFTWSSTHSHATWLIFLIHVTCLINTWHNTYSHTYDSFTWGTTHSCDMTHSRDTRVMPHTHILVLASSAQVNESRRTWMSLVTCEWVMWYDSFTRPLPCIVCTWHVVGFSV